MSEKKQRIIIFDIEASALNASFGHTLCIGWKVYGEKGVHIKSLADFPTPPKNEEPDVNLVRWFHKYIVEKGDILVTWYGKGYDRPFLNTRMLMAGLPPMPPLSSEHVDLYYTSRAHFAFHANHLNSVSEALGCPYDKTPVRADVWRYAQRGDKKSMAYVIKHCKLDVQILDWVYGKFRAYVRQHPPVTGSGVNCRVCGAHNWDHKGRRYRAHGVVDSRAQCRNCGTWSYFNQKGLQVQ